MEKQLGFETLQVHAGYSVEPTTGARAVPIYQTTAYNFDGVADARDQFELKKPGSIYSRISNPTVSVLEQRLAALEGGVGTVCFASGMAAILASVQNLAESGSEIIALSSIYGGSHTLFFTKFKQRYGITAHRIDPEDLAGLEAAINDKTRCVYIETLGNPSINIPDIEGIAAIAHRHGLPVIADNTFGSPYLINCRAHGIDIAVHSLTKYVGGHGSTLGGGVTDLGTFSFKGNPRFAEFNTPDESYHGLVYADLGAEGYLTKLRSGFLRDTGASMDPMAAFLMIQGVETLSLRMERHSQNAQAVAEYLYQHPSVAWVNYPGLAESKFHARAEKYFPNGCGGILTFGIKGGLNAGRRFIEALQLFSLVANVADVRSLVIHPASTTHGQMSEQELITAGVPADMIRLSVGIESIKDLLCDLEQALKASQVEEG